MTEAEFLLLYERLTSEAKKCLKTANNERESLNDWPADQEWNQLGNSSKSIFIKQAREALGMDPDWLMMALRDWPYSDAGWNKVSALFDD